MRKSSFYISPCATALLVSAVIGLWVLRRPFAGFSGILLQGNYWRLFLVPFAVYMIWKDTRSYESYSNSPLPAAFASLLAFSWIILSIPIFVSDENFVSAQNILGISVFVLAFAAGSGGARALQRFFVPTLYVVFMTGIAAHVVPSFSPALQRASAAGASSILGLFGFSVVRDGVHLRLPGSVLIVGEWCSGVNQVLSLLAISVPLGVVRLKRTSSRVMLVAASVPIAILFNSLRIGMISLWNYNDLRAHLHGPGDILLIPVVYPFSLALLYMTLRTLERNWEIRSRTKFPH